MFSDGRDPLNYLQEMITTTIKPDLSSCLTKGILREKYVLFIDDAIDTFFYRGFNISACVTQQFQIDKRPQPGPQTLEQASKTIRHAMELLKTSGPEASTFLASFVEEIKQVSFFSLAINRYRVEGPRSQQPDAGSIKILRFVKYFCCIAR